METATRRGKDGASDGKTVIVSESEDSYSDRGLHKRERSFPCECGGGNKRVRERKRGRVGRREAGRIGKGGCRRRGAAAVGNEGVTGKE